LAANIKTIKKSIQTEEWYLLYTTARAEKKVQTELLYQGHEVYLPMYKTLRQWSDRKKWVEVPLFNSYIFIKIVLEKHYYDILNIPGIAKFVSFEHKPVKVLEEEIRTIQLMLGNISEINVIEGTLEKGAKIMVVAGPLIGLQGSMVEYKGKKQVMVAIESINHSLLVSLPENYLKLI